MTSSGSTTTGNTPVLVMSYEKFAEDIKAGNKFNFDFYITNKSTAYDVRNVNVKINGGDAFTVVNSGDTIYKNGIAKNQTAEFSKKLICNKSVSSGYHPISLSVTYEYVKAGATEQGTAEATFTVKTAAKKHDSSVSLTPRLVVGSFNYGNKSIRGGKKFTLNFTIKNNSKRIKAKNVIIKLSGGDVLLLLTEPIQFLLITLIQIQQLPFQRSLIALTLHNQAFIQSLHLFRMNILKAVKNNRELMI